MVGGWVEDGDVERPLQASRFCLRTVRSGAWSRRGGGTGHRAYDGRVDIWFWIVVIVAAALVALVIVNVRATRSRVDPTQLSIDAALAAQVRKLYAEGDRLQAVKALRAATGLGLADAVRIVDKMGARAKPAKPTGTSLDNGSGAVAAGIGPDHTDEVRSLVAAGRQSEAVTLVQRLTGMGLQDAKDYVERM